MTLGFVRETQWCCCLCANQNQQNYCDTRQKAEEDLAEHLRDFHFRELRMVCRTEEPITRNKYGKLTQKITFTGRRES